MSKAIAHPGIPHKYMRVKVRGRQSVSSYRWRCVKPGCHHYLLEDFIVGAVCECWRCGKEFVIERVTALLKPHCRNCTRRRNVVPEEQQPIPESPI